MVASGPGSPQVRTLIVGDVRLYREGLAAALRDREHIVVVGSAGCRAEALRSIGTHAVDLVIVDVALAEALDLMRDLRAQSPATRIVAFAVNEDIADILDCAEAGAAGFVAATASMDDLVQTIERTIAGELLCSPRMAAELLRRAAGGSQPRVPASSGDGLTNRETQVLRCMQQGLSNKEIASSLNIAEATVKNHVHHVLEKLNIPSRNLAAGYAAGAGVVAGLRVRSRAAALRRTS